MKIKQKITTLVIAIVASVSLGTALTAATVSAAECGGAKTSILSCSQKAGAKTAQDSGVWGLLLIALNIMTDGVGILAVGGIVYASILYASSSDNAAQTKQAKDIIKNVAIGLIAYAGMYLAINWLIPGGVFR